MGRTLEIGDIHSPTVPQRPVSKAAEDLNELLDEKLVLEETLGHFADILEKHGVDMSTPLVDQHGYPRADIDIAQIRIVRAQVIRLRNDHKDLMSRIEKGLHELHQKSRAADQEEESSTAPIQPSPPTAAAPQMMPFALVESVALSSPAAAAGLEPHDKILKFGTCYAHNHAKLTRLAEIVQVSEGRTIDVVILRHEERVSLKLTPKSGWGGRGMLGCHLLPM